MVRRWGPILLLVVALVGVGVPRAHASDTATAWRWAGCPDYVGIERANGVDSDVVPLAGMGGQWVRVQWRATLSTATAFTVEAVSQACGSLGTTVVQAGIGANVGGAFALLLPSHAGWLLVHHRGMVAMQYAAA